MTNLRKKVELYMRYQLGSFDNFRLLANSFMLSSFSDIGLQLAIINSTCLFHFLLFLLDFVRIGKEVFLVISALRRSIASSTTNVLTSLFLFRNNKSMNLFLDGFLSYVMYFIFLTTKFSFKK